MNKPEKKTAKFQLLISLAVASFAFLATEAWAQSSGVDSLFVVEGNLFWLLVSAFGVGVLLTFTPCVLPMIPIVSAIIVGQGDTENSQLKGGILSIVYVLGTVATYATIGAVAGATGEQLQAYFQNPWVLSSMALLLFAGSLALFGLYELRLPSRFESQIQTQASRIQGRSIGAIFLLGLLSALIVGACVTPLLISVVGVVVAKGDPLIGAAMMSSMALGMGVFLIAIGFGLSYILPKAGMWMERVKHVLGIGLLAVAIYLLGAIPGFPSIILWAILFIVVSVYLGATQKLSSKSANWHRLGKSAGIIFFIWGITSLAGAALGNRDVLNPLPQLNTLLNGGSFVQVATTSTTKESLFVYPSSMTEFDDLLAQSKLNEKPVLIDFYADWCLDCVRMDRTTFADPDMIAFLQDNVTTIKVDVTDPKNDFGKAIRKRYSVFGPPAIVLLDTSGKERPELLTYGYLDVEELLNLFDEVYV